MHLHVHVTVFLLLRPMYPSESVTESALRRSDWSTASFRSMSEMAERPSDCGNGYAVIITLRFCFVFGEFYSTPTLHRLCSTQYTFGSLSVNYMENIFFA